MTLDGCRNEFRRFIHGAYHHHVRSRPGKCKCLGCGREFSSPNVLSIRFCDNCRYSAERVGGGREYRLRG